MDNAMTKLDRMPVRIPVSGTFELTLRCNLHCKMCMFRHEDCENKELQSRELTAKEWIDIADDVANAGTINLLITGGEPMLRPDFCEIWEGIYRKGFLITLYTNATVVNSKIFETLKKYPPHEIHITIYGSSSEIYEKVCGSKEAFSKFTEGVHKLQMLPSVMHFRTTLIKDNYEDFPNMEKLLKEEFGYEDIITQSVTVNKAVRGGCADVESCRLSPEVNRQRLLDRKVDIIKERLGDAFERGQLVIEDVEEDEPLVIDKTKSSEVPKLSLLGCKAGMKSYTVTYDGKLLGCQMLDAFWTDVRKDGFDKAWEMYPYEVKLPPLEDKCNKCELKKTCQTCYATRYAETGRLNGYSDYICADAFAQEQVIAKYRRKKL